MWYHNRGNTTQSTTSTSTTSTTTSNVDQGLISEIRNISTDMTNTIKPGDFVLGATLMAVFGIVGWAGKGIGKAVADVFDGGWPTDEQ